LKQFNTSAWLVDTLDAGAGSKKKFPLCMVAAA